MTDSRQKESYFDSFMEKYCRKHEVTPEEAKKHAIVQEMARYYRMVELEEANRKLPEEEYFDTDIFDGCGGGC